MANMLENYGLEFFRDSEDVFMGLVGHVVQEGKAFVGYSGTPYLFEPMGNVEFWVSTERKADGELTLSSFSTHCGGKCVWDMLHTGIDITPEENRRHSRTLVLKRAKDQCGLVPIELITSDVLPSFLDGDRIRVQVIAQPLDINYYADEEEYDAAQPEYENGKKLLTAPDSLFAAEFLYNHTPDRYEQGKEYASDSIVLFHATVTHLYCGTFDFGEHSENLFIRCFANTDYGELEFDHTYEQVPEALRDNIKVGSVISGACILSGDVAINEYENGAVKDFDHDLRLLRYTFEKGEADRLRSVLAEDAVYETDTSGASFSGVDAVIERFKYVRENTSHEYYAYLATITESNGAEYLPETRCIVLASDEKDNYESVVFINVNGDGLITRIKVSTDSRYSFLIDKPEEGSSLLDGIKLPDSIFEPIINRAKFNGLLDPELDAEVFLRDIPGYKSLEDNAQEMLDALRNEPKPDAEVALENILGYLFAKAMEQALNEKKYSSELKFGLTASYCPQDAFNGVIRSTLPAKQHGELEKAMALGKQFYKDLRFFVQLNKVEGTAFIDVFKQAAVIIQRLGQLNAEKIFED